MRTMSQQQLKVESHIIWRLYNTPKLSLDLINAGFWSCVGAQLTSLGGPLSCNAWVCCWFGLPKVQGLDPIC